MPTVTPAFRLIFILCPGQQEKQVPFFMHLSLGLACFIQLDLSVPKNFRALLAGKVKLHVEAEALA